MSDGKVCKMDVETAAEKKMTLEQKRKHYRCDMYKHLCSNCPQYHPLKKDKPVKKTLKKTTKKAIKNKRS